MAVNEIPPSRWQRFLESLSRTHRSWPVEVMTSDAAGLEDRSGAVLTAASYDPSKDRFDVDIGDRHLAVSHPRSVALVRDSDSDDERELRVEGRKGCVRVRFLRCIAA